MRFFKIANIKKTIYYFKRNGIMNTFYTVWERCIGEKTEYSFFEPEEAVLDEQRKYSFKKLYKFSILVPAYETKEVYLRELIESVLKQTYTNFELIIADAGKSNHVEQVVKSYDDRRIKYIKLKENGGISENTNEGLKLATGDYVGLLDHDDILTGNALFEMAKEIEKGQEAGRDYQLLYSDEDKCDGEGKQFFDPHIKTDFNLDLLLSNNYICHFLVMKTELMKELGFRKEYDGAQDYDIILRAVEWLLKENGYEKTKNGQIGHVPQVLYHWRCHEASTAENPESKKYAYDAGKRAVTDFVERMGWHAKVEDTCHVGFYRMEEQDIFSDLGNVGAIGGKVLDRKNRVTGNLQLEGKKPFEGLYVHFSGYMHRASLWQTMDTLDLRCIRVHPDLRGLFEEITGMGYTENEKNKMFFGEKYKKSEEEWSILSNAFCEEVKKRGYRLIFYPKYVYKIRKK